MSSMKILPSLVAFFVLLQGAVDANRCERVACESDLESCLGNATYARCVCKSGYFRASSSNTCERDCDIQFCFHKGTCERGPNGRACRCVSPYHGNRCENEKKVVLQIAIGSSIMAVVLIIFVAVIIRNNNKEDSARSDTKKRPWEDEKAKGAEDTFNFVFNKEVPESSKVVDAAAHEGSKRPADENDDEVASKSAASEVVVQIKQTASDSPKESSKDCKNAYVNEAAEEDDGSDSRGSFESEQKGLEIDDPNDCDNEAGGPVTREESSL